LSAKWRRSKGSSSRFNIFKAFSRNRKKGIPQVKIKRSTKRQAHPNRYSFPKAYKEKRMREPEPLIDILEEKGEITVVAEFVGFNRENLRIHVKNQRLTLSADASDRKYYKSLNLPKRVIPSTIHTTYKNGVLEVRLRKAVEEKTIDEVAG